MGTTAHLPTLPATPIPRSIYMALSPLRPLATTTSPPTRRSAGPTFRAPRCPPHLPTAFTRVTALGRPWQHPPPPNMAVAGLRHLASIAPPPGHRVAVPTFVAPWDVAQLREAFERELARGGQVYFLHNDVESIGRMQRQLSELVPEARIGIAHGQMLERELERVMLDFHKQSSEERRVGKECVRTGRSRWSPQQ